MLQVTARNMIIFFMCLSCICTAVQVVSVQFQPCLFRTIQMLAKIFLDSVTPNIVTYTE